MAIRLDGTTGVSATGNITTDNYFIGNGSQLTGITTGNVDLTAVTTNIIPSTNVALSLGNSTHQWKDLWISNNTIFINSLPLSTVDANGTATIQFNNQPLVVSSNTAPPQTANIATTADIIGGNLVISNVTPGGGITFPDGTIQTTAAGASSYGNANVEAYLPTSPTISNITNSIANTNSNVANLTTSLANTNANVANTNSNVANVATGVIDVSNALNNTNSNLANVSSNVATLQGQVYTNTNVAAYLGNANTTGNIYATNITAANTVTATTFIGNFQGNITGNLVVPGANTWVLYNDNGNAGADIGFTYDAATQDILVGNTVTANFFVGDGSQLTGLPAAYGNANVEAYLPTSNVIVGINGNVDNVIISLNNTNSNVSNTNANVATLNATVANLATSSSLANTNSNVANTNANVANLTTSLSNTNANVANLTTSLSNTNSNVANNASNITTLQGQVYANANAQSYLASNANVVITSTGNITTTANISGAYILGNGSQLTGLPANYGNTQVEAYLPSSPTIIAINANVANTNSNVANLTTALGNTDSNVANLTSDLTNTDSTVANLASDLANTDSTVANLVTITTNTTSNVANLTTTLDNTNNNVANNSSNITTLQGQVYGNANVAAYLPTYTGNLTAGNVVFTGNLLVQGTTTTVDSNNVSINDLVFNVANNANAAIYANGAGLGVGTVASEYATFLWNSTSDTWTSSNNLSAIGNVQGNYILGNGSLLTGLAANYGNSDVTSLLSSGNVSSNIITTGNVTAGNITFNNKLYNANTYISLATGLDIGFIFGGSLAQMSETAGVGFGYVALGTGAGYGSQTVAIGDHAGVLNPGAETIAIGPNAGNFGAGAKSIAIGQAAGAGSFLGTKLGANSIAIGAGAAAAGSANSVIVLNATGANFTPSTSQANSFYVNPVRNLTGGFANSIFYNSSTKEITYGNATAIGNGASSVAIASSNGSIAFTLNGDAAGAITNDFPLKSTVALGVLAGSSGNSGVAIGYSAANLNQGYHGIALGWSAGRDNQGGWGIALGTQAAYLSQGQQAIAIGVLAGSSSQGENAIAIGANAGKNSQPANSIIINGTGLTLDGSNSGFYVAPVRNDTGNVTNVIYYNTSTKELTYGPGGGGSSTSISNGTSNVSIGSSGGNITMAVGGNSVGAITAGSVSIGYLTGAVAQGANVVAIGSSAGANNQGTNSVAIGYQAGNTFLGGNSVAIGYTAAGYVSGANVIAIGYNAGNSFQGSYGIALGAYSGNVNQGANAVAIGRLAGSNAQGANSVAIGYLAGNASQPANSVIINGSGNALNGTNSGFYAAPIRNDSGNVTNAVYYNTTTKEVTYGPGSPTYINKNTISGNVTLTLAQGGTFLYSTTAAADTVTIPSNANVAFPVGTTITVVLQGVGSLALTPQANVSVYLGGNSTSATRTISPYGIATLIQVAADTWFINGTGVY